MPGIETVEKRQGRSRDGDGEMCAHTLYFPGETIELRTVFLKI